MSLKRDYVSRLTLHAGTARVGAALVSFVQREAQARRTRLKRVCVSKLTLHAGTATVGAAFFSLL